MSPIDYARVCYYGDPGSGKTGHAATLANLGRVPFFLAEPGLKYGPLKRRGINVDNIKEVRNVTSALMMEKFWQIKARLDDQPGFYSGAVLDTLGVLVNKEVAAIRKRDYEKAVAKAEAAGEEYEGPPRNKFGKAWDVFGEMTADLREVIENYVDLPMHLVFTSHVRRDDDEDTASVQYGPASSPAVQHDVIAWFDTIIRTERRGKFFIGHTVASDDGRWLAKDRDDALPRPIMNLPTMERIIAYINGDLTEKNDPIQAEWVAHVKKEK